MAYLLGKTILVTIDGNKVQTELSRRDNWLRYLGVGFRNVCCQRYWTTQIGQAKVTCVPAAAGLGL